MIFLQRIHEKDFLDFDEVYRREEVLYSKRITRYFSIPLEKVLNILMRRMISNIFLNSKERDPMRKMASEKRKTRRRGAKSLSPQ